MSTHARDRREGRATSSGLLGRLGCTRASVGHRCYSQMPQSAAAPRRGRCPRACPQDRCTAQLWRTHKYRLPVEIIVELRLERRTDNAFRRRRVSVLCICTHECLTTPGDNIVCETVEA